MFSGLTDQIPAWFIILAIVWSLFVVVLVLVLVMAPSGTTYRPHLIHQWGPWEGGTAHETYNGIRTGRTASGLGRRCQHPGCDAIQARP